MSAWLFLRGLGITYLLAFLSLWVQIEGLLGSEGILPAEPWLGAVEEGLGADRFARAPTLCWWLGADAAALNGLCAAGTVLSLGLVAGVLPGPVCVLLWAIYLSLVVVGRTFLAFQWDMLLLETGAIASFLAPWRLVALRAVDTARPALATWLLRALLFKLMFLSGVVKLGDPTWRDLTALDYHYWTTCLPVWPAWYVHKLPLWFHRLSAAGMFFVELVVPFFVFAPRRPRLVAAGLLVALQLAIAATGNYGFFNVLGVLLCVPLLDDEDARRLVPGRWARSPRDPTPASPRRWRLAATAAFALVVLPVSLFQMQASVFGFRSVPAVARAGMAAVAPFRSVNGYGLFANMTTARPEIIVEGSNDGEVWRSYEFKWKPGDPRRAPGFVQPHMPRLDWQMWFAALSDYRRAGWFVPLLERLRTGSPAVLALLHENPFPDAPPALVRAVVYDYRFTTWAERRASGAWWRRTETGLYCPIVGAPRPEALGSALPRPRTTQNARVANATRCAAAVTSETTRVASSPGASGTSGGPWAGPR